MSDSVRKQKILNSYLTQSGHASDPVLVAVWYHVCSPSLQLLYLCALNLSDCILPCPTTSLTMHCGRSMNVHRVFDFSHSYKNISNTTLNISNFYPNTFGYEGWDTGCLKFSIWNQIPLGMWDRIQLLHSYLQVVHPIYRNKTLVAKAWWYTDYICNSGNVNSKFHKTDSQQCNYHNCTSCPNWRQQNLIPQSK